DRSEWVVDLFVEGARRLQDEVDAALAFATLEGLASARGVMFSDGLVQCVAASELEREVEGLLREARIGVPQFGPRPTQHGEGARRRVEMLLVNARHGDEGVEAAEPGL